MSAHRGGGNPMPVPYGEMLVGSRRISQDISTRDEGETGKWWLSGGMKIKKSRRVSGAAGENDED
ncbi:tail assembly protein [Escherichia coli O157:H7]|nr:tail assembly protein [Escherichia coli O157:H7]